MNLRLKQISQEDNLTGIRVLLAFAELVWAITLYWPGETFGRPTYNGMASLASEIEWAAVFLISAILQGYVLYRGVFSGWLASSFAAWNSVLWVFVCASMYLSVFPPPAAISGELSLAMGAVWVFFNTDRKKHE